MPFNAPYAFMVSMDVETDKEELFNEVYDEEHIPMRTACAADKSGMQQCPQATGKSGSLTRHLHGSFTITVYVYKSL